MALDKLLARYYIGALTEHELVVDSLLLVDPTIPSAALDRLPLAVLPWLRDFVQRYTPGKMRTTRADEAIPTEAQVTAAKQWLDELLSSPEQRVGSDPSPG
jgi:hypothetical protein